MKILIILAALTAALSLACGWQPLAGEPELPQLPENRELPAPADPLPTMDWAEVEKRVRGLIQDEATASPVPTATPMPTPVPTATPLPEGVGICYRTPEVQDWIIQQLNIPSCRVITEPELYRITDRLYVNAPLKPGDLSGLVNVPAVDIDYGHCGDWENPDYTAAVLDGLNPDAQIRFNSFFPISYDGGLAEDLDPNLSLERKREYTESRFQGILAQLIYPSNSTSTGGPVYGDVDDLVDAGLNQTFSIADLQTFPSRAREVKAEMNRKALSIAQAIGESGFGKGGSVKMQAPGQAVIIPPASPTPKPTPGWGWSAGAATTVDVEVVVSLVPSSGATSIPHCREEG